jgi:hypothetical protein
MRVEKKTMLLHIEVIDTSHNSASSSWYSIKGWYRAFDELTMIHEILQWLTSCVWHKDLNWGWYSIGGFAGIIARVRRGGLCYNKLRLGFAPAPGPCRGVSGQWPTGFILPTTSTWGKDWDPPFNIVIYHAIVMVPKYISGKKKYVHYGPSMKRPLEKTPWKDPLERSLGKIQRNFYIYLHLSRHLFTWKVSSDAVEIPQCHFKGSFPVKSLTVHSVCVFLDYLGMVRDLSASRKSDLKSP